MKNLDFKNLIKKYREENELKDLEVAARLGIPKSTLSDFLNDRQELSLGAKINLLDNLGYTITRDLLISILPKKTQETILKAERARLKNGLNTEMAKRKKNA